MSYQVKLDAFKGPFDLLLHLVKKDEVDIYDIPIAKITEEYLDYIKLMQILNLEVTGEFLVMAGTLVYIKSRMLLPSLTNINEEIGFSEENEDPRKELVQQLLEYKKFKESAKLLEVREIKQKNIFYRLSTEVSLGQQRMLEISLFEIMDAFKKVLRTSKKEPKEIIQEEVSIEIKIEEILNKIKDKNYIDFYEIFGTDLSIPNLIATFLALLELIRLKIIKVFQTKLFGKIRIYRVEKEDVIKQFNSLELTEEVNEQKEPALLNN